MSESAATMRARLHRRFGCPTCWLYGLLAVLRTRWYRAGTTVVPAAIQEPIYSVLNLRVRFDPPELEHHALLEKDNIIEHLRRLGYDVGPNGLVEARRES